jgi:endonuclease/exonuclease/phosphatase family metal-dependent hydrolase
MEDAVISLLTYNIHHGADENDHFTLDAIIETIRNSGANIIALQEVDRVRGKRSNMYDEARYIADKLGMNFVFKATKDSNPGEPEIGKYGIMILSKFAIMGDEFYLLPSQMEQRGVLCCTIRTGQGDIPVCCTHLGLPSDERINQITALLEWLPQQDQLILMGDFNTAPGDPEILPLYSRFDDLQEKCGLGGTGTFYDKNSQQWVRDDYIFSGRYWQPVACRVIDSRASDHLPVYVEVGPSNHGEN